MASRVPPAAAKRRPPPNYIPKLQGNPDSLSDNLQNLNLNRPPSMPNSGHTPLQISQSPPFPSSAPSPPLSRPSPPPGPVMPQPSTLPPNLGRPTGPPVISPPPFMSRPTSGATSYVHFPSSGPMGGPVPPPSGTRPLTAAPPVTPSAVINSGPRYPPAASASQPPAGPPPTMQVAPPPRQAPSVRPFLGNAAVGSPPETFVQQPSLYTVEAQAVPPFSVAPHGMPPYSTMSEGVPPPQGFPFGSQAWPALQVTPPPPIPGSLHPPRGVGAPSPLPNQSVSVISHTICQTGNSLEGQSKIDPSLVPRPSASPSVTLYETRQGNQANIPPPASSDYIVRDTGNCSPRYMRCTINQIPCTVDLLAASGMQLALLVQPFALPHPSEDPIQVVDFGESGPVRCSRCKGYINPFMKFIDQGRKFICNLCGLIDETPRDYHCNLGPDGRRRDADERLELCRGAVEFVASKEYMVRDPMPPVFFFLIDVSMNAVQTGATAAACSAISQVIANLPEGPLTMVGMATFDSTIHFYNLKPAS